MSDLWAARFLFWNLVRSGALAPYANVFLGFVWTLARPLVFLSVVVFLRRQSGARMGESIEYPLFLFCGIVLWWYFTDATRQAARSMTRYRGLVTKVYFPRIITPLVPVTGRLLDIAIQLLAIAPLAIHYGRYPDWRLVLLPVVVAQVAALALGLGYIFSVLSARARDFERFLEFSLYAGMFLSPVIFSITIIPEWFVELYAVINPMVGPLDAFRACLFGDATFHPKLLLLSGASTLIILVSGIWLFLRAEERLAELIS